MAKNKSEVDIVSAVQTAAPNYPKALAGAALRALGLGALFGGGWRALAHFAAPAVNASISREKIPSTDVPIEVEINPKLKKQREKEAETSVGEEIRDTLHHLIYAPNAKGLTDHPLYPAALTLGVSLGGLGGYYLIDKVLAEKSTDRSREALRAMREKYYRTLNRVVSTKAKSPRQSAKTDAAIDYLGDTMEKVSVDLNAALGPLITVATLLGVPAAIHSYFYFRKRQPASLLEKAIEQQTQQAFAARPTPVQVSFAPRKKDEEEER